MIVEEAIPDNGASRVDSKRAPVKIALLAVLIILGVAARVVGLGARPLWDDEAWTFFMSARGADFMFRYLPLDNHPPLYYLAEGLLLGLFGSSEASLRLVAVLAGVLTVAVIGPIASRLWGRGAGMAAAALAASAPLLIYYSQEARFYSVLGLETLVGGWLLWQHAERPTRRSGALAVAAGLIAAYTHYFGTFLIAFGVVAALWRTRKLNVGALAPAAVIFVSTLPLVPLILSQKANYAAVRFTGGGYGETVSLQQSVGRALVVLGNGGYPDGPIRFVGYGSFLLLAALIVWRTARTAEGRRALAFPLLLSGVLVVLWQIGGQLHLWPLRDNYVASIAPAVYLLVSGGAAAFGTRSDRRLGTTAVGGILLIMLSGTIALAWGRGRIHPDYREASRIVNEWHPDGLLLARSWGDLSSLRYYCPDAPSIAVFGVDPTKTLTFEARVVATPLVKAETLALNSRRLCIVGKYPSGQSGFDEFGALLRSHGYALSSERQLSGLRMSLWERPIAGAALSGQVRPAEARERFVAPARPASSSNYLN
jgi:4-amino-4-deoxy-L-arabinose transferase-like glycosyltransferase